jgi:hypothetical protein
MVTPSYVRSQACRDEVVEFLAGSGRDECLLAIMVRDPDAGALDVADNPAVREVDQHITAHQYLKPGQPLESLSVGSAEFRHAAQRVAEELKATIDSVSRSGEPPASDSSAPDSDAVAEESEGLLEIAEHLETTTMPALSNSMNGFENRINQFLNKFSQIVPSQGLAPKTAHRTLVAAAQRLEGDRRELDDATTSLIQAWDAFNADMKGLANLAADQSIQAIAPGLDRELEEINLDVDQAQLRDVRLQVQALAKLSTSLRPIAQTLTRALGVFDTVQRSVAAWGSRR